MVRDDNHGNIRRIAEKIQVAESQWYGRSHLGDTYRSIRDLLTKDISRRIEFWHYGRSDQVRQSAARHTLGIRVSVLLYGKKKEASRS